MLTPLSDINILVADDMPINLLIIKQVLTDAGATVFTVNNGREALELLQLQPTEIHMVLLDLQMPELDGYETTTAIRHGEQKYSSVPIIAISGDAGLVEMEKCCKVGMNDFIAKPFERQVICEKILALLRPKVATSNTVVQASVREDVPAFDLSYLKEVTNGEDDKLMMIVNNLLENGPLLLQQAEEALETENWSSVSAYAHKLKGLVGLFFMHKIIAELVTIEEASKDASPNKNFIHKKINYVGTELMHLQALIINVINKC